MIIGVIGAGRVGGTLGRGLARAGHTVVYGLRNPEQPAEGLDHPGARVASVRGAVAAAEVLLLATPWAATAAALADAGDLGNRPLLDVTNPLGPGMVLTHGHTDSGAEQVQRWAPTGRVVKVFNTTGMENMADPHFGDHRALMLACGDDEGAVTIALSLATDLGFEALPFGPLRNARLLEPLGRAWIELALVRGAGRGVAFGLLRR
ncbi:MAG TPA: NAD(P)-binding domain-containing protein [Myxococcota bacterium]|nr:NAD(P)-binding domain-containing protein [Myxococcota bacterium]HNH48974.1 NAD(P)-binding domain-containing protein [Myxococcota bacterium]